MVEIFEFPSQYRHKLMLQSQSVKQEALFDRPGWKLSFTFLAYVTSDAAEILRAMCPR